MSDAPERLFHGSPNTGIDVIKPAKFKVRSPEEGAVVFATPNKAAAMKNLFFSDDSWTQLGTMNKTEIALIASTKEDFIAKDTGGACYELPGEGFVCETKYGGGRDEWTSRAPVTPVNKEVYPSALDAMIEHGVQVYFVSPEVLKQFDGADDDGKFTIVKNLLSENERRGLPKPDFASHD